VPEFGSLYKRRGISEGLVAQLLWRGSCNVHLYRHPGTLVVFFWQDWHHEVRLHTTINRANSAFKHRIDTGPEVSLRRYFFRNFTSADVKIRHHMTPSWSAHGSFS
jgi:hypothetical protein